MILLGEELDFRDVALRNGAQQLDTGRECQILNFQTNMKTNARRFSGELCVEAGII